MSAIFNAIDRTGNSIRTLTWAMLRILSSTMFMTHGFAKLFGEQPQPFLGGMGFFGVDVGINMLWVAGVIEFFAGGLIALGLFTRPAALLAAILMVMAYLTAHAAWFPTLNNGELAGLYLVVFLAIFSQGAGPISLDAMIFGKR